MTPNQLNVSGCRKWALVLLIATSSHYHGYAQKNVNVSFEKIAEECKGLPLDKRVRMAVARFSATTPVPADLGANMATMLTNALQETSCFRMLEQLNNMNDLTNELKFAKSENSNGNGPEAGKMMSAQVIVTGEVTEYSVKSKGVSVGIVKTGSNIVKMGFVLKLVSPETREILFTKSINVEGKVEGKTNVGIGVRWVGRIDAASSSTQDPALANALEKGIISAVEYMASVKNDIPLPATDQQANNGGKTTTIKITNADFTTLSALSEKLSKINGVSNISKSLNEGTGEIKLSYTGSSDALLTELSKVMGNTVSVTGFSEGKISLKKNAP